MIVNADKLGGLLTKEDDSRVTRVGRWLRKSKLDELPQLWNVLVGDMSFVGPRPEVAKYVMRYTSEQREVLKLKPGITDWATMLFHHEETLLRGAEDVEAFYLRFCLPRKIELNLQYAQRATLLRDLWIIAQTLHRLLSRCLSCGVRLTSRLLREHSPTSNPASLDTVPRVAIIGTGKQATNLALDFGASQSAPRRVVAFFDDNPRAWRHWPHDIPVMGMPECLLNSEWLSKIDEVIVALPEARPARLQEIREMLKRLPVRVTFASTRPPP